MDELKAGLRLIAQQLDTGTTEAREALLTEFETVLSMYLTTRAVQQLSIDEARRLYVKFNNDLTHYGLEKSVSGFMRHIGVTDIPRQLPEKLPEGNVVGIFR